MTPTDNPNEPAPTASEVEALEAIVNWCLLHDWYTPPVGQLFEKGLLIKYGNNQYRPTDEARQMLDEALAAHEIPVADNGKPATITAAELVNNLAHWATLKDARKLNLIWKGDHIDFTAGCD